MTVVEPTPGNSPLIPQPFPSWKWVVNQIGIGYWDAPIAQPKEDQVIYYWDEPSLSWKVKNNE
jgi:hypothetical protein